MESVPNSPKDIQNLVEKNISSDDLVAFRIHGVSPEFVRSMKEAGYAKISPDQLVAMRIHGVDASFVKEVREHGYKDPTIDDLIELRIHGLRNRESLVSRAAYCDHSRPSRLCRCRALARPRGNVLAIART